MSKPVFRIMGLMVVLLSFSRAPAWAETPASDAEAAARELVTTMKLDEQFKALMPMILKTMKPAIVQNRADVERDFDTLAPKLLEGFQARMSELSDAVVEFIPVISAPRNCAPRRRSIARQPDRNFC
jgi:hypothetical protein